MNAFKRTAAIAGLLIAASTSMAFAQSAPATGVAGAGNISSTGPAPMPAMAPMPGAAAPMSGAAAPMPADHAAMKGHKKHHKAKMPGHRTAATSPGTKSAPNPNNPHAVVVPGTQGVQQFKGN